MMAALVAAALGQRLNTNREWQAFAHTLILGEHTANVNSLEGAVNPDRWEAHLQQQDVSDHRGEISVMEVR